MTDRFEEAERNFIDALNFFQTFPGSEDNQAGCQRNLGVVYRVTGRHLEELHAFEKALSLYSRIPGSEISQAICMACLAMAYRQGLNDNSNANLWAQKALKASIYLPIVATRGIRAFCRIVLNGAPEHSLMEMLEM
jgi:tetratricopeptide (TPR) repeat protein